MKEMRARLAAIAAIGAIGAIALLGCGEDANPPEVAAVAPSASAAAPPETIAAREFCQLLYGDLGKQLEAECRTETETLDSFGRSSRTAALREANEQCMTQLDASVATGRLQILKAPAEACAKTLNAVYREGVPLRAPIDLGGFDGCAGMFVGELPSGAVCRTALECKSPLVCKAPDGVDKPFEGTCSSPAAAGERCWPYNEAILLGARDSCAEGTYCPGAPMALGLGAIGLIGHGGGTGVGGGNSLGGGYVWQVAHGQRPKPAASVKMGVTLVTGRLPPEVIQRVVRRNFGRFRACYETGLQKNPSLEGRVAVKFVIDPKGAIKSITDAGSTLPDKSVVTCVTKSFQGLTFPEPEGGSVQVTYPLIFAPPLPPRAASAKPDAAPSPSLFADAGTPPSTEPPARVEPGIVQGPWSADAPKAGLCRGQGPKGHGCLVSEGCARGLVCVGQVCVEPSAGRALACQTDRDCSIWQRCNSAGATSGAGASFGVCGDRKPAKSACENGSECRGGCVAGACDTLCPQR